MTSNDFQQVNSDYSGMDLFSRFEMLSALGLEAHETKIGHPERPYQIWEKQDFDTALNIFKSWPKYPEAERAYTQMAETFSDNFTRRLKSEGHMSRAEKMTAAAEELTLACRESFGEDFPEIKLNFVSGMPRSHYAGLTPEDEIDINADKIQNAGVPLSTFDGDLAFIEVVTHESTHLVQRYLSCKSDGETQDMYLSARVAEMFYEATDSAKEFNRDLYWLHPFETEARDVAKKSTETLKQKLMAHFKNAHDL